MKGISAVIAVVLILMITVALAAMAYVWFTGVFETITGSAGQAATQTGQAIATQFSIASAGHNGTTSGTGDLLLYITNTGAADMTIEDMNVFIGITKQTINETGTLSPGNTQEFVIDNSTIACDKQIKVTYGSLEEIDVILCE